MKNLKKSETKRAHTAWNDHIENPDAEFKGRKIPDEVEARLATGQSVAYSEVNALLDKIKNESQNNIATSLLPEEQKEQERREALLLDPHKLDSETFGKELDTLFEEAVKGEVKATDNAILKKMEEIAQIPVEYAELRELSSRKSLEC